MSKWIAFAFVCGLLLGATMQGLRDLEKMERITNHAVPTSHSVNYSPF